MVCGVETTSLIVNRRHVDNALGLGGALGTRGYGVPIKSFALLELVSGFACVFVYRHFDREEKKVALSAIEC